MGVKAPNATWQILLHNRRYNSHKSVLKKFSYSDDIALTKLHDIFSNNKLHIYMQKYLVFVGVSFWSGDQFLDLLSSPVYTADEFQWSSYISRTESCFIATDWLLDYNVLMQWGG